MSKSRKRTRSAYRERIDLEDDLEVVHARTSHVNARGVTIDTPPSPQRTCTTWILRNSWGPEDNTEFALEQSDDWVNVAVDSEVFEHSEVLQPVKAPKKRRSKRSVCLSFSSSYAQSYMNVYPALCAYGLAGSLPSAILR